MQKKNKGGEEAARRTDVILERMLKLALTDKDLKKTNDSILELEDEIDAFGSKGDTFKYSDLSKQLHRGASRSSAPRSSRRPASWPRASWSTELAELKQLLANGVRIKFETTTKEKEFLEEQLQAGGQPAIVKKYKYSVAVADDQLYWPYEGEYWRDELGTYQYTLTKGCIERKTANQNVSDASARGRRSDRPRAVRGPSWHGSAFVRGARAGGHGRHRGIGHLRQPVASSRRVSVQLRRR